MSHKDFFKDEFRAVEGSGVTYRILDIAAKGNVLYMAMEKTHPERERVVFGLVVLTQWKRKDWNNFAYKPIEDNMGPVECDCPARILDLLTPTDHEHAIAWRQACRDRLAKRKAVKVHKGDTIRFAKPIEFRSGAKLQELVWEAGSTFHAPDQTWNRFRVTRWRDREFQIVKPEQAA